MILSRKIATWIYKNTKFPNGCKTGNELDWMLKDNCPCCVGRPLEWLSNEEYHQKYPAKNKIQFGVVTIYLCDVHFREMTKIMEEKVIDDASNL